MITIGVHHLLTSERREGIPGSTESVSIRGNDAKLPTSDRSGADYHSQLYARGTQLPRLTYGIGGHADEFEGAQCRIRQSVVRRCP